MFGKKRYGTKRASYQFVMWFPHFVGFGFKRTRIKDSGMAMVYDWFFWLGFFEIRKWKSEPKAR